MVELSKVEQGLLYGLSLTPLTKEEILIIPEFLDTEEMQLELIYFLKTYPNATAQEIKRAVDLIVTEMRK